MKWSATWGAAGTPTRSVGNGGRGGSSPRHGHPPPIPAVLTVLRAFPCRSRLGDAEAAGAVEEEVKQRPTAPQVPPRPLVMWGGSDVIRTSQICQSLFLRGLSLVGWYHSHPFGPALPSLHDIDTQMDYQLKLQGSGNGFQPCLALICGKRPPLRGGQGVAAPPSFRQPPLSSQGRTMLVTPAWSPRLRPSG